MSNNQRENPEKNSDEFVALVQHLSEQQSEERPAEKNY